MRRTSAPDRSPKCHCPNACRTVSTRRGYRRRPYRAPEYDRFVSGIAIITEACIETKDRACVDVCPVQCIYEYDPQKNILFSEEQAGSGVTENTHTPNPDSIAIFGDTLLYVNLDECTPCTAC